MESWLRATIPAVPQGICLAPRKKLQGSLKPQGLGERKHTFYSFLHAKPAPELKYHVAPHQHLPGKPWAEMQDSQAALIYPTGERP